MRFSFQVDQAICEATAAALVAPVTWASRGLSPPGQFAVGFRLPVDSASHGAARRARRTNKRAQTGEPAWAQDELTKKRSDYQMETTSYCQLVVPVAVSRKVRLPLPFTTPIWVDGARLPVGFR